MRLWPTKTCAESRLNDQYFGGRGADVINGGAGSDTLSSDNGLATFVFDAADATTGTDLVIGYDLDMDVLQVQVQVQDTTLSHVASLYDSGTNTVTVSIAGVDAFVLQSRDSPSGFGLGDITIIG